MKKVLELLNEIKEKGLIKEYALGGSIAAIFYTEPVFTYDLDVFIIVKHDPGSSVLSFSSIYDYLVRKGYAWKSEHLMIEDMPVQFLPASGELEKESIEKAKDIIFSGIKTRVLSAEHLIAIALKVGRGKDFLKIDRMLEQAGVDQDKLEGILNKYDLQDKFKEWKQRFG